MNQNKIINKIFYWANLNKNEVLQKEIKGLHSSLVYRIFTNLRNAASILRRAGSGRKEKLMIKSLKWLWRCWKYIIPYQHSIFKRN